MTNEQKPQPSSLPSTDEANHDVPPSGVDSALSKAQKRQKRSEMFGRGESPAPPSGMPSQARQLRTDTWGRSADEPAAPRPSAPAGSASSLRDGPRADPQPAGARKTRGG